MQQFLDSVFAISEIIKVEVSSIAEDVFTCQDLDYRVYTNKCHGAKFFTPQMRRLFEGGAYLKVGRDKELY